MAGGGDTRDANKLWGLVFLVFLVAVPALIVGAVAFSKLPSDCAEPKSGLAPLATEDADSSNVTVAKEEKEVHWDYTDTAGWGALSDSFKACSEGRRQSPINIMRADAKLADSTETTISLSDFQDGSMFLSNSFAHKATMTHNGHAVGAAGIYGFFNHNAKWYKLLQFHFHTPSEHTVDGFTYPAEAHFVHQSVTGEYLVVGVLLSTDNDVTHASMEAILSDFPRSKDEKPTLKSFNYTAALEYLIGPTVNGTVLKSGTAPFYTYSGSFTTPPCTEGVKWILMQTPKAISNEHLVRLQGAMGVNNRPVLPLNERSVLKKA